MLKHLITRKAHVTRFAARSLEASNASGEIDSLQLARLARAVMSKSPEDLAALAEANPLLAQEWIDAFRRRKLAAEAEARYWSAAMAALSTATPDALRVAAE